MYLTIENRNRDIIYREEDTTQPLPAATMDNAKTFTRSIQHFWEVDSWSIDLPGICFMRHNINVKEDIYVRTWESSPLPALVFMHRGQISSRFRADSTDHIFSPSHHAILFNPFDTERTVYKKQAGLDISMIIFKPEYFLQVANDCCATINSISERILSKKRGVAIHKSCCRMTLDMYRILAEIGDCPFHGELRTMYLQAKAMELLVLQCAQLEEKQVFRPGKLKLSGDDLSKLHAARAIITENFRDPPSLMQLARLVGINDFKLKAGFKTEFSTTVFGYLNELRLDTAKKDLLQKKKSLTEIAYDTGYSSLSHFSNAFKKRYGVSPVSAQRSAC